MAGSKQQAIHHKCGETKRRKDHEIGKHRVTTNQIFPDCFVFRIGAAVGHGDSERVVAAVGHEWHVQGLHVGPWRMPQSAFFMGT